MILQQIWDKLCFLIWDIVATSKMIAYILGSAVKAGLIQELIKSYIDLLVWWN